MRKDDQYKKILAYLDGMMEEEERKLFHQQLLTNNDLQNDLLFLGLGIDSDRKATDSRVKKIAEKLSKERGSITAPRLRLIDRIRIWTKFGAGKWIISSLIILFIFVWVFFLPTSKKQNEFNIQAYIPEPYCPELAGQAIPDSTISEIEQLYISSQFVCGDSLGNVSDLEYLANQCQTPCIAHYYLAFKYLENKNYNKAAMVFDHFFSQEEQLQIYSFYRGEIPNSTKFAHILARLGADPSKSKEFLAPLEQLLQRSVQFEALVQSIESLIEEIKN